MYESLFESIFCLSFLIVILQELAQVLVANSSSDYHSSCGGGSQYGSTQHIYASPQSPTMQHQDFSLKLERIFNIVKDCHSEPFLIR